MIYYPIVSVLPIVVSATILILYLVYELKRHRWYGGHNILFYIVCLLVLAGLFAATSTIRINKQWEEALQEADTKQYDAARKETVEDGRD
jgi:uncharacterized membrane protein